MKTSYIAVICIIALYAILTMGSTMEPQQMVITGDEDAARDYIPMINLKEFIPIIPESTDVPGFDVGNYPEDEEVSSIPPENEIPFNIPQNTAVERLTTFSLVKEGAVFQDVRQIALISPDGQAASKIIDFTKVPRIDIREPLVQDPYPVYTACSGPCPGLSTSLNLSSLSTAFKAIITPLLAPFQNKSSVIRSSWPRVTLTIVTVSLNSINLSSQPNGKIGIALSVTAVGKLHVKTKLLGSATTTFNIVNYTVSATASLAKLNQKLNLANFSVVAGYNDLNIHTSGGLIMKFIIKVASTILKVKSTCRTILTSTLPQALQGALSKLGTNTVNNVPWKIKVGKWGAGIKLGVVELNTSTTNNIVVGFSAETINFATGEPYQHTIPQRHSLSLTPVPQHLFGILIDTFTINDYVNTWFAVQNKATLYTHTTCPQWLTALNTAAWNLIFPGIGTNHPQSNMVMKIDLISAPQIIVNGSIATLTANARATWAIDNGMGQVGEPLVAIDLNLSTGLTLSMKYDQTTRIYSLVPALTHLTPNFAVNMTVIGPIDMTKVNQTLQAILNNVVVPIIDLVLMDGIPIPATANLKLTSPTLTFVNNAIQVGSGVTIQF